MHRTEVELPFKELNVNQQSKLLHTFAILKTQTPWKKYWGLYLFWQLPFLPATVINLHTEHRTERRSWSTITSFSMASVKRSINKSKIHPDTLLHFIFESLRINVKGKNITSTEIKPFKKILIAYNHAGSKTCVIFFKVMRWSSEYTHHKEIPPTIQRSHWSLTMVSCFILDTHDDILLPGTRSKYKNTE